MSPTSYLTAPPRGGQKILAAAMRPSSAGNSIAGQRSMTTRRPGRAGAFGGLVVDHAELHPDGLGADRDRLVDVRGDRGGAAEEVDDLDPEARLPARECTRSPSSSSSTSGLTGMTR